MGAIRALIVLLLCYGVAFTAARAQSSTHLPGGEYPGVSCGVKPARPTRPTTFSNNEQIDAYNETVEQYNQSMEAYIGCVQAYVDKATSDLKLIKQRIQEAIDQAGN